MKTAHYLKPCASNILKRTILCLKLSQMFGAKKYIEKTMYNLLDLLEAQHIPFLSLKWVLPLSLLALMPSCCQCLFCIRFMCIRSFALRACRWRSIEASIQVKRYLEVFIMRRNSAEKDVITERIRNTYQISLIQISIDKVSNRERLTASGPLVPVHPRAR